uniref:MRG domain-containing protein n=1 Tax=Ditylenchus dipsaci TaxID=166011 RepID=A0A915CW14_9BILA
MILVHCNPPNPEQLWEMFKDQLSEDFMRIPGMTKDLAYQLAYASIVRKLINYGKNINTDFPSMPKIDLDKVAKEKEKLNQSKHVKKSDEEERDLTTVRIQYDPVWKLKEEILCDWKGRGIFYKARIVRIVQYEDEPVYVVNYPGYRHADEKVLQSDAFNRFLPMTDENVQKVNVGYFESAKKVAEEKRKSKGSIARGGSIGRRSVAVAKDTPVRRGRPPGKSSIKRGRDSVKRSDSNSTASLIDSFMPGAELGAKRPKIGRQGDMNTSEGSVVPATPESESPEDAENTGTLPKKLKEIFEMDRHRVEIDYKLPVIPARFSVKYIINGFIDLLKESGDEDQTRLDEAKCANSSIIPDKSLINCAVLVVEELLRCFDDSTVEKLLYYYEKPYFESLSKVSCSLQRRSMKILKKSRKRQMNQLTGK